MPKRAFLGHQLTGKWTANDCIDVKFTQWIKYTTIMQENIPFLRKFALKSAVKFHDIRNWHLKTQNIKSHLCWLWAQRASPPLDARGWLLQGHHHWPSTLRQSCSFIQSPQQPHERVITSTSQMRKPKPWGSQEWTRAEARTGIRIPFNFAPKFATFPPSSVVYPQTLWQGGKKSENNVICEESMVIFEMGPSEHFNCKMTLKLVPFTINLKLCKHTHGSIPK